MPTTSVDVLARLRPEVPTALAAHAENWSADQEPVRPRLSASVVLVRTGSAGLEVYLLHRHARMAFAASMVVFPGGGLDPVDESAPDPVRACAVRETLEETGVRLEPAALHDWAHWVTPEPEPRRFDTRFFVAVLPDGELARDVSGETDRAGWAAPAAALVAAERGEIGLMPPTVSILIELAEAGTVPELLARAAGRLVLTVRPRLVRDTDGWRYSYPPVEESP